mmetsp:Transcript_18707/g.31977  ORF Transcript_18707/g.31977 Transcript_18707/m.31977 type:complete len:115 (+) Transcript_18707:762-1106(+)
MSDEHFQFLESVFQQLFKLLVEQDEFKAKISAKYMQSLNPQSLGIGQAAGMNLEQSIAQQQNIQKELNKQKKRAQSEIDKVLNPIFKSNESIFKIIGAKQFLVRYFCSQKRLLQ